ncbi:MAG: hypothetical protein HOP30_11775 [Cyclobacteriaceae bacterium]|nr:hypothetical protein [Cyclobacteriaceae bacterium]
MNRNLLILPLIVLFVSCQNEQVSPSQTFTNLKIDSLQTLNTNIPHDGYTDLTFVNENVGYAVSVNGRIVKTTNAGLQWQQLELLGFYLSKVQFVDEQTGFIAGGDSEFFLLNSTDGGTHWTTTKLNGVTNNVITGMYFLNKEVGFVCGNLSLQKTSDGGKNFVEVMKGEFTDLKFKNNLEGVATSLQGVYYKTRDGGASWQRIQSVTDQHISQVYFVNDKNYIQNGDKLININTNQVIQIPSGAKKLLFLSNERCIGIGQEYESQGFFPFGYIYLTNNNWSDFEKRKYQPSSEAKDFRAIAKVNSHKTLILGSGQIQTLVVQLNY